MNQQPISSAVIRPANEIPYDELVAENARLSSDVMSWARRYAQSSLELSKLKAAIPKEFSRKDSPGYGFWLRVQQVISLTTTEHAVFYFRKIGGDRLRRLWAREGFGGTSSDFDKWLERQSRSTAP